MAYLLRKIRKAKWYKNDAFQWLAENDIQADALGDLGTKDNRCSFWHILEDKSNLALVVCAVAAGGDSVSNFDFAIFEEALLAEHQIKVEHTPGVSYDHNANETWHRDLSELSISKIMALVTIISSKAERSRFQQREVLRLLVEGVRNGRIDSTRLKPAVAEKVAAALKSIK